ncbi:hypothetical protein VNO77_33040 [Canavalia gladiata]|uniref:Mediator of RNA polymerase II transcription subunit 25 n=1 Tax=Canavalia gladiata TaxID=3824 RepID=A0AAN9KEV2_CANGL
MVAKKWLNIIVDGNSALGPYWPQIVSDYLVKIVRSFYGYSTEQRDNNASRELGLVMYNANSYQGLDVQYIHWTKDVDYFLGTLSCLSFNGENPNQYGIVEGLAEALVMFPRPPYRITTQEYYEGERHCLLITASDPVPRRTLVSLPRMSGPNYGGTQLETMRTDFLEVSEMFVPGNNDPPTASTPMSDNRMGDLTVLFSKNFKEANEILYEKRILDFLFSDEPVDPMDTEIDPGILMAFTGEDQGDLFLAGDLPTGEQNIEAAKDDTLDNVNPLPLVAPNATPNETHAPSQSMNVYEDIMAEIADKDIFLPRKKSKTDRTIMEEDTLEDLFLPDEPIPLDDSLAQENMVSNNRQFSSEVLGAVEEEPRPVLRDIAARSGPINNTTVIDLTSNSPMLVSKGSSSKAVEGSQKGPVQELGRNKGVVNPALNSGSSSNPGLLLPQKEPNLWPNTAPQTWHQPSGRMSTAVRLGIVDPWDPPPTGSSFGNTSFPHAAGNSLVQSQPHSSSLSLPHGTVQQKLPEYHQYQMTGFGPLGVPAQATPTWVPSPSAPPPIMPPFNPRDFWPPPQSLTNFHDFVHAWEGSLVGKIHANRTSLHKAKALRRTTSSFTLTVQWSIRLEIALYVPQKAVTHTLKICRGPIDYVFIQIMQFNNLDLYEHLMSKNLCAKIDLPSQTLVVSPTESKYHFIGTVFPGVSVMLILLQNIMFL